MRILWNHVLDSYASSLTASSEATNYDANKVLDPLLFRTFRTTGVTAETLVFDAGVGQTFTFDSVFISNHNLTSGATVKFQMNATDSWGAPSVDETLTWRSTHIVKYFTSSSYRFCRFYFDDAANTDGYIQIGRVSATQYLQITPSSLADFKVTNVRNDLVSVTPSRNVYGYLGSNYRTFTYSFPPSSYTMINNIRTMYNAVGKIKPVLASNYDLRYTEFDPCYCIITNDIEEEWREGKARYSLVLQEVGGYNS